MNNASHEDLKQKGIVQKIINGGMKRPNEGDDGQPRKRYLVTKLWDAYVSGKPMDDEVNT